MTIAIAIPNLPAAIDSNGAFDRACAIADAEIAAGRMDALSGVSIDGQTDFADLLAAEHLTLERTLAANLATHDWRIAGGVLDSYSNLECRNCDASARQSMHETPLYLHTTPAASRPAPGSAAASNHPASAPAAPVNATERPHNPNGAHCHGNSLPYLHLRNRPRTAGH